MFKRVPSLQSPKDAYYAQNEFVDYAPSDRFARIIAIAEAKCSSLDPFEGERQAADYLNALRAKNSADP